MKLKYYFWILILMLVGIGVYLVSVPNLHSKDALAVTILSVIILLAYLVFFYTKCIKPFHIISNGMGLLKEQDFSSRLRKVGQYEADEVVELFNRLMERLKNERLHVREQNEFLDLLIQATPQGIIVLDHDGKISNINPAAHTLLDLQGHDIIARTPKEVKDHVRINVFEVPLRKTRTIRLGDGTIYQCRHEAFVDQGFARSFYLIESLTEEVHLAEKKAYEKVIRMIAHEVNNSTAGITSSLMTIDEVLEDIPQTEDLRNIMKICVDRCYSMSHFITRFAEVIKIPPAELVQGDINQLVCNLSRFMESIIHDKNIKLTLQLDEKMGTVNLDATLMEQVLLNIVKNAVESIVDNGQIIVATDATYRTLTISDDGAGISPEVAIKLFSPFFSTKPTGQGLGLIFVREVLTQHHCTYSLSTDPTDGLTRFVIRFPL